jgi:dTDP-4-amino-4,6-dideoxygalactose transaminase
VKKINLIRFGKPYIGRKEVSEVSKVMQSAWIGTGEQSEKFEQQFAKFKKVKYAVSLNSCTAALHLSLVALGIKKGDEVITSSLTFCSTINSIILSGAKPVLVDIKSDTFNIDESKIESKINKRTKAIIPVHFGGLACSMHKIKKIAKKHSLKIVEDCAHSIEGILNNKHLGTFGDTGCFSFYANKNITTGEGGMLVTNNKLIYEKAKILRLHGMSRDSWKRYGVKNNKVSKFMNYDVVNVGFKYNMTDMTAAMGLVQLKKIILMWRERNLISKYYSKELKNLPIKFQIKNFTKIKHAHHLFVFILDNKKHDRLKIINLLNKKGIGATVHYNSLYSFSIYKKMFNWKAKDFPISDYICNNIVSLPIYPGLKKFEMVYIAKILKDLLK